MFVPCGALLMGLCLLFANDQTLWSTICKVLVNQLGRMGQSVAPVRQEDFLNVTASLDKISGAMSVLALNSQLMGTFRWR